MNAEVRHKPLARIRRAAAAAKVASYEEDGRADDGAFFRQAAGLPAAAGHEAVARHAGAANFAFLDGHVVGLPAPHGQAGGRARNDPAS